MISGYLHLENRKIQYGTDLGPFRVWPFSGHKNYIVSKLWNLQFVSLKFGRFFFGYDI